MVPVIHHVELCVRDIGKTVAKLRRYGLRPFATRENRFCKQVALKLNSIVFIVNEKISAGCKTAKNSSGCAQDDYLTVMCSRCEDETSSDGEHVDTVFNVALDVKNVQKFFSRAAERINYDFEKYIIQEPTIIQDHFGKIEYCIIKSCGNVIHVCLNKDQYKGPFLPGFEMLENVDDDYIPEIKKNVTHIDHVTLACYTGYSERIIEFYKSCFGMEKFSISSNDDEDDGLILKEGVGLRLRAMEFYRCYETGLICPSSSKNGERTPNSLMLVVVESLQGQIAANCNVQTFLKHHMSEGIEHIALGTNSIIHSVSKMKHMGVEFRLPPECYYTELRQRPQIQEINLNLDEIAKYGILLDREEDPNVDGESAKPKYLMQIFAMPIFDRKTVFIEIIQRHGGARGLGAGNILALVKSIREDERRKAAEADKNHSTKDARRLC